jgi:Sulphur transport
MRLAWLAWLAAALCVVAMGFAIQRGGTCTVAAIDELLGSRRATRLAAILEASLWVAGGLAIAHVLRLAGSMPAGHGIDRWTFAGATLLGLGAWLNRACVVGTIARFGSGEWAYAFTPLGFYVGCLSLNFLPRAAPVTSSASPLFDAAAALAPLFVAYALWRAWTTLRARVWTPHAATIVIGVCFLFTLWLAGRWAYTDLLADLAQGMAADLLGRSLLFAALLAGAMFGGWSAGRWRRVPISTAQALRCFAGGALMGWGSLLIPGSNDGLVLVGLPLLQPYAWLAFAIMCLTIALAMAVERSTSFMRRRH